MVAAEKSSVVLSSVVTNLVFLLIFSLVFVFASIALAYAISQYFGQDFAGFEITFAAEIIMVPVDFEAEVVLLRFVDEAAAT